MWCASFQFMQFQTLVTRGSETQCRQTIGGRLFNVSLVGVVVLVMRGRPRVKAEKARLKTQLKAAQAGNNQDNGKPRTESQVEAACREVVAEAAEAAEVAQKEAAEWRGVCGRAPVHPSTHAAAIAAIVSRLDSIRFQSLSPPPPPPPSPLSICAYKSNPRVCAVRVRIPPVLDPRPPHLLKG